MGLSELMTVEQVAEAMPGKASAQSVRRLMRRGLRSVRIGRRDYVRPEWLEEFIEAESRIAGGCGCQDGAPNPSARPRSETPRDLLEQEGLA